MKIHGFNSGYRIIHVLVKTGIVERRKETDEGIRYRRESVEKMMSRVWRCSVLDQYVPSQKQTNTTFTQQMLLSTL